uniref:SGTA homodimerisation domain-containing protein n=1 Tax=Ditylenchus dipsaci TaxID=166011 RepID=A0A915D1N3_9BILA
MSSDPPQQTPKPTGSGKFLRHKVSSNQCTEDQIEGLEVAVQCLETAFNVSDLSYAFQPSKPLLDIFTSAEGLSQTQEEFPTPTAAEIEQANKLKEEGNELLSSSTETLYFCNRAAAYCRQEQFDLAIQDCRTALALEPNYAKAYGRMGVALSCQNRYDQAVEAYKKLWKLIPTTRATSKTLGLLRTNSRKLRPPMLTTLRLIPLEALVVLEDYPLTWANMMSQMMGTFMGGNQGGEGAGAPPNLENLLRAGESMAARMSQANPELVEQLRRQFGGAGGDGNGPDDNNPAEPRDPSAPAAASKNWFIVFR